MSPWGREFRLIVGILIIGLILGLLLENVSFCLLITISLYLTWHLIQLYRLEKWLREAKKLNPPYAQGIWGDVFYHFYLLQQRNKKRKKKLAFIIKRFKKSTTAMPDATVVINSMAEIEWMNQAAKRLLNLRSPQDVGSPITISVRNPDFVRYFKQGDYTNSVEIKAPVDNQIMLNVKITPFGNKQKLLLAQDMTKISQLETMRKDFVGNVSHELRTPLTVLNGCIETIQDAPDVPVKWKKSLDLIQQQGYRMRGIVEDLLILSRLESGNTIKHKSAINVELLLTTIKDEAIALGHHKHLNISQDIKSQCHLNGNEEEIRSAFTNLVANAIHYTPDQGCVELIWYETATHKHFSVKDTGVGISEEHLTRLTERFYRVDISRSRNQGGTGLGLSIVKHVLHRHQAQLHIASKLGQGTEFRCDFPNDV